MRPERKKIVKEAKPTRLIKKANSNKKTKKPHSAQRSQSQFIAATSHQFRTPLSTIQTSIDLVEYYIKTKNWAKQEEVLKKIRKTIRYLTDMLDNITSLYKYNSKKLRLNVKNVNIRKLLNDLLEEIVINISDNQYIMMNLDPTIGIIVCDEFVIKQILLILINNAVKYSPSGGQIKLDVTSHGKYIEFVVRDEGIGIDKKDLKNIFIPFIRGRNTVSIPGVGLGLAIAKNLAMLHKAEIFCDSSLDQGSEFILRLFCKM